MPRRRENILVYLRNRNVLLRFLSRPFPLQIPSLVDENKDIWFDDPLGGKFEILTSITMDSGRSNYTLRVQADVDITRQLEIMIWMAQCYRIGGF